MVLRCTLLLALAAGAFAGPISRSGSSCATTCPDTGKFNMQTGSTYEYDYTADVKTSMVGASEEHSSLHMTANVQIEVLSRCELALVLKEVVLLDSNPRDWDTREQVEQIRTFKRALEAKTLRFAWIDGLIEHICPDDEDKWVLNIKRGILSNLQNTMESWDTDHEATEIDISGRCPVTYQRTSNGFTVDTITKVKDILACADGHNYDTVFHGIPYNVDSRIQSLPLMDSSHLCKQDISSDNVITKVTCSEIHVFRPFSTQSSGATTEVTSTLTFKGVQNRVSTRLGAVSLHEYLIYDSTPSADEMADSYREALSTLQKICTTMPNDVRPEVPGVFVSLIHDMRKLDTSNLAMLHKRAKNQCSKAMQFFRDAVPNIGSSASLALIRDLISRGEVSDMEAEIWLTSLSFIARPSLDLLSEAASMLTLTGSVGRKANLAVSSLINNYCHLHDDCAGERQIQTIMKIFEDNLGYNCRGNHDVIMMSLKAFGNAGAALRSASILNRCFNSDETEVRIEAIKAFRRLPCSVNRDELMNMYTDASIDSEIRIQAFLEVMRCATTNVIARVRSQLENEQINQVGSFVWTYLTNLAESNDPHKVEIGDIIMDEKLAKEFDLDKRKFSRNMEWSVFSHMLNTGGTLESNLIWSEKSFVPRSAMVNLTVHMFGHAMNLIELGGRTEGLDALLGKLFGPSEMGNDIRSKRSTIDQGDINVLDGRFGAEAPGKPKASLSVKVFGNEIRYDDFHGIDIDSLKDKVNFLEWLIKLSEDHNIEVTKNSLFLDASYVMPTGVGMPLKLLAEGSSTINLKLNGKLDLRSIISNPAKIDILGSIEPSAAVEVTSVMGVDAHIAKTGLKMVSTLHTSTVASGKIYLEGGKILSVDVNVPREKLEIFEAKSTFYITHRDQNREQRMLTDTMYSRSECLDLVKSMGIELCAKASIPLSTSHSAPLMPFTGPMLVQVYGMKRDTFEKYHFESEFKQEMDGSMLQKSELTLVMDTPGSRVSREVAWKAAIDHVNWDAEMTLRSPWKQFTFNADLQNTDTLKALSLVAKVDDSTDYSLTMRIPITQTKNGYNFSPEVVLIWPGLNSPRITGELNYQPKKKIDFNLRMRNVFSEPAKASGEVIIVTNNKRWKRELKADVQSPLLEGKFEGLVDRQGTTTSSRVVLSYKDATQTEQSWNMNAKLKDESFSTFSKYELDSQWTSTVIPNYNGDFNLKAGYGKKTYTIDLNTGFDSERRIILKNSGSLNLDDVTKTASGEWELMCPWKGIEQEAKFTHSHNKDELSMKYDVKLSDKYAGLFEINLRRISMNPLHLSSNVKLHYPGREFEITEELEEKSAGEYSHNGRIQLDTGYVITAESLLKMKSPIELTSTINVPGKRPIKMEGTLKPVLSDLLVKGSMNIEGEVYSTEATLKYGGDTRQHSSTATFDLVYPGRHVTMNSEYNYKDGVINGNSVTMWDADNDRSKQSSTVYRMTLSATNPALYVKQEWYPNQFVELDTSATIGDQVEGQLTFKNKLPVDIAKEWKFGATWKPQQFGGILHLEGSADDDTASLDLGYMLSKRWDKHGITLDITTPLPTWRTIKLETSHEKTPRSLEMTGAFALDGKEVRLVSENAINWKRKTYNGGATLTTPWEGMKEVGLTVRHTSTDTEHTSSATLSGIGNRSPIKYKQVLTIQPGEKFGIVASLETPFSGFESLKLNSVVEKSGNTYSTKNEFEWATSRAVTIEASMMKDGYAFDGRLRFTTPFESLKRFVMNINNVKDRNLWVSHFDMEYAPTKKIEVDTKIDLDNYKKLYAMLKCDACPYIGTTSFDGEITGNLRKHNTNIEIESTRLLSEPIRLTTVVDVSNIHDMSAELKLTSPVGLESLDVTFTHNRQGRVYNSQLVLTIPTYTARLSNEVRMVSLQDLSATTTLNLQGDEYQFVTSLKGQPNLELSVMLTTPIQDWPKVGFELKHQGTHTDFKTTFDITYGRASKMTSALEYTNNNDGLVVEGNINGLLNKDFKVKLHHKGDFYSDMETTFDFTYGQTKQIATQMPFSLGRNSDSSLLSRILPLLNKEVKITFKHKGSILGFVSDLELDVDNRKVSTKLTYNMRGAKLGGSLTITTPWPAVSKIFLEMNHDGPLTNFENDFTWELNDRRYHMENKFSYRRNRLSIESEISTPIRGYETITAKFDHTGSLQNFDSNGEINFGNKKASFEADFDMRNNIKASMVIITPFNRWGEVRAKLEHTSTNWQDFSSDLDLTIDGRQYTGNLMFKWVEASMQLEASASTPDSRYSATVRHRGDKTDFDTRLTIVSPDGNIVCELKFKNDNGIDSSLTLTTPYDNYDSFSLTVKHNGPPSNFDSTLTLATPWRLLRSAQVSVKHSGDWSQFTNSASLTWNSKTLSATSSWEKNSRKIGGSMTVTTPWTGYDNFAVSFAHVWSADYGFTTTGSIETPWTKFTSQSFEVKYSGPWNDLDTSVTLTSSIPGYERFAASLTNKLISDDLEMSAKVETPIEGYKTFELTIKHNGPITNFDSSAVIETSVSGSKRFTAQVRHNMVDGIKTSFSIRTPWSAMRMMSGELDFDDTNTGFELTASLTTPFENWENQVLTVTHTAGSDMSSMTTDARLEWATGSQNIAGHFEYTSRPVKISAAAKLTSSMKDLRTILNAELTHKILDQGFESVVSLTTPWAPKIGADVTYKGVRTNFEATANVESGSKRIETECVFSMTDSSRNVNWKLKRTPWQLVQNMEIAVSREVKSNEVSGKMALNYNSDQVLDFDLSFTKSMPHNVHVIVRQPWPMEGEMNYNKDGKRTTSDIKVTYKQQTFTADLDYTCGSDYYKIDDKFILNAVLPSGREMSLNGELLKTDSALKHDMSVGWQRGSQAKWNLDLSKSSRRDALTYSGTLNVESPLITQELSVNHVVTGDTKWSTTVSVPRGITITNELVYDLPTFSHVFAIEHPKLRRGGLRSEIKGTIDPDHCKIEGEIKQQIETEQLSIYGKIEDESGTREKIVWEARAQNPAINLDFDTSGVYTNNDKELSLNTELKHKTAYDRQMKTFSLKSSFEKDCKDLNIDIVNPMHTINIVGRLDVKEPGRGVYEITRTWANKVVKLEVGREQNSVYVQLARSTGRRQEDASVRAEFTYNSMRDMKLEVSHTVAGTETRDVLLGIRENRRQNTITAQTFMRQNMAMDLGNYMATLDYATAIDAVEAFNEGFWNDFKLRREQASSTSLRKLQQTINLIAAEQMKMIQTTWNRMIRNNEMYLSDIVDVVTVGIELSQRNWERMTSATSRTVEYYQTRMGRIWRAWVGKMNERVNAWTEWLLKAIDEHWPDIQQFHAWLEKFVNWLDETVTAINNHPWVRSYYATLERVKSGDFMRNLKQWREEMEEVVKAWEEKYKLHLEILRDVWRNFNRRAEVREFRAVLDKIWGYWEYVNENYNIEETMVKVATKLSEITWDVVKDRVWHAIKKRVEKSSLNVWDPQNAHLDVELYIPRDLLSDLSSDLPDFYIRDRIRKILVWLENSLPDADWTFWDYYYYYKPPMCLADWIPPFKSWATLAGTQHYMTFDKRFYEFAGDCSYLLARDFIDRKFAVVVNYESSAGTLKKSITVTDGINQVEILPTGEVKKDGTSAELPLVMDATTILREGNVISVRNDNGVNVLCDLIYDRCTVEVTGWYYGKTAGLLGTYDNEPITDWVMSDGSLADNIDEFTRSWTVGRCRSRNTATIQEPTPGTRPYEFCSAHFKLDSSPFRHCFKIVNPEHFMRMCVNDFASNSNAVETVEGVCKSAAFYVEECSRNGVTIRVPTECAKCKVGSTEFTGEKTLEGSAVPRSADVVFVVQHADCNTAVVDNLRDFIDDLEADMAKSGLSNNRYGVVGYGGYASLNKPHSLTMGGQLFNSQDKFSQTLAGWSNMPHGTDTPDTLRAIMFAAQYPFRAGVSKTIVVIPCAQCDEVDISYNAVQNLLFNNDIRLHVIMDHEFMVKEGVDKGPQTAYLYGADKDGIFTKKHLRGDLTSDRELYNQVKLPGDLCSSLIQVSKGAVFDVNQFTNARKADQKRFVQVMVRVIADRAAPSTCQKCRCVADSAGAGVPVCRSCSSNIMDMLQKIGPSEEKSL